MSDDAPQRQNMSQEFEELGAEAQNADDNGARENARAGAAQARVAQPVLRDASQIEGQSNAYRQEGAAYDVYAPPAEVPPRSAPYDAVARVPANASARECSPEHHSDSANYQLLIQCLQDTSLAKAAQTVREEVVVLDEHEYVSPVHENEYDAELAQSEAEELQRVKIMLNEKRLLRANKDFVVESCRIIQVFSEKELLIMEKTLFEIETKYAYGGGEKKVCRRFSDFEWLFTEMRALYLGYIVPGIPQKDVMALFNVPFINSEEQRATLSAYRRVVFQIFLNKVLEHDELRYAPCLHQFLQCDDKHFQSVKERSEYARAQPQTAGTSGATNSTTGATNSVSASARTSGQGTAPPGAGGKSFTDSSNSNSSSSNNNNNNDNSYSSSKSGTGANSSVVANLYTSVQQGVVQNTLSYLQDRFGGFANYLAGRTASGGSNSSGGGAQSDGGDASGHRRQSETSFRFEQAKQTLLAERAKIQQMYDFVKELNALKKQQEANTSNIATLFQDIEKLDQQQMHQLGMFCGQHLQQVSKAHRANLEQVEYPLAAHLLHYDVCFALIDEHHAREDALAHSRHAQKRRTNATLRAKVLEAQADLEFMETNFLSDVDKFRTTSDKFVRQVIQDHIKLQQHHQTCMSQIWQGQHVA